MRAASKNSNIKLRVGRPLPRSHSSLGLPFASITYGIYSGLVPYQLTGDARRAKFMVADAADQADRISRVVGILTALFPLGFRFPVNRQQRENPPGMDRFEIAERGRWRKRFG